MYIDAVFNPELTTVMPLMIITPKITNITAKKPNCIDAGVLPFDDDDDCWLNIQLKYPTKPQVVPVDVVNVLVFVPV